MHGDNFTADLSNIPLGALRKVQHALSQAEAVDESGDEDSDSEQHSEDDVPPPRLKGEDKAKPEWNTKRRTDLAKRSSKHAWVDFLLSFQTCLIYLAPTTPDLPK